MGFPVRIRGGQDLTQAKKETGFTGFWLTRIQVVMAPSVVLSLTKQNINNSVREEIATPAFGRLAMILRGQLLHRFVFLFFCPDIHRNRLAKIIGVIITS